MAEREGQEKPLAQSHHLRSDATDPENIIPIRHVVNANNKSDVVFLRRAKCIKYCGCASAIVVIAAVAMIILAFTVFHVRPPTVKLNSVTVISVESNLTTLVAEFSVRNPNAASFRYETSTAEIFLDEVSVGEGSIPGGIVRARRTLRKNVTVVLGSETLTVDSASESLTMKILTKIEGRVKIGDVVKKRVVVELNCGIMYDKVTRRVQIQDCISDVNI